MVAWDQRQEPQGMVNITTEFLHELYDTIKVMKVEIAMLQAALIAASLAG